MEHIDGAAAVTKILTQIESGQTSLDELIPPSFERLRKAINSLNEASDSAPSPLDLAILTRQVLRNISHPLLVTKLNGWPSLEDWKNVGVIATPVSGGYRVSASPWQPDWITDTTNRIVDEASTKEIHRGSVVPVPGDPFLKTFGRTEYRSEGQRAAIRSAINTPPGGTLAVSLPTGEGKSFVAQVVSTFGFGDDDGSPGITLMICPTVSLSKDQEMSALELFSLQNSTRPSHPLAYTGSTSEEDRAGIRDRIREGNQGLCITSPEAACNSLLPALDTAAIAGHIRAIVIDEAHLIDTWGANFRSAFQLVSGVCRELIQKAPSDQKPRTILLSATLTSDSLDILQTLFPGYINDSRDSFRLVSSQQLRPEIEYWTSDYCDEDERTKRVVETILHTPRPAILYVTKPDDASRWITLFRQHGLRRIESVTGKTSSSNRNDSMESWRNGDLDLVVGTSAFGLGIDNPNVRTVIHACIPETIDRFYQEVGRGGRDGKASISIVIPSVTDEFVARRLNERHLLTIRRGFQRWSSMFFHQDTEYEGGQLFRIKVDVAPSQDPEDIDMYGRWSTEWNNRLLGIMANARLINLLGRKISTINESDDEIDIQASYETFQRLEILDDRHLDETRWEEVIEPYRLQVARVSQNNLHHMFDYLTNEKCTADLLDPVYSLKNTIYNAPISKACGGCNHCREEGKEPFVTPRLKFKYPPNTSFALSEHVRTLYNEHNRLVVFYPLEHDRRILRRWEEALYELALSGVRNFEVEEDAPPDMDRIQKKLNRWPIFVSNKSPRNDLPSGPRIIILGRNGTVNKHLLRPRSNSEPHFIFVPETVNDPDIAEITLQRRFEGSQMKLNMFIVRMHQ